MSTTTAAAIPPPSTLRKTSSSLPTKDENQLPTTTTGKKIAMTPSFQTPAAAGKRGLQSRVNQLIKSANQTAPRSGLRDITNSQQQTPLLAKASLPDSKLISNTRPPRTATSSVRASKKPSAGTPATQISKKKDNTICPPPTLTKEAPVLEACDSEIVRLEDQPIEYMPPKSLINEYLEDPPLDEYDPVEELQWLLKPGAPLTVDLSDPGAKHVRMLQDMDRIMDEAWQDAHSSSRPTTLSSLDAPTPFVDTNTSLVQDILEQLAERSEREKRQPLEDLEFPDVLAMLE